MRKFIFVLFITYCKTNKVNDCCIGGVYACVRSIKNEQVVLVGKTEDKEYFYDISVDKSIILKEILKTYF